MTYPLQRSLWKADGTRRQFYVYIMSNKSMTRYTGVTNDLDRRLAEHRAGECAFTARYHFDRLVFYECFDLIDLS
jgi:putative endonuclease